PPCGAPLRWLRTRPGRPTARAARARYAPGARPLRVTRVCSSPTMPRPARCRSAGAWLRGGRRAGPRLTRPRSLRARLETLRAHADQQLVDAGDRVGESLGRGGGDFPAEPSPLGVAQGASQEAAPEAGLGAAKCVSLRDASS